MKQAKQALRIRTATRLVWKPHLSSAGASLPHVLQLIDGFLTGSLSHEVLSRACEAGASEHTLAYLFERIAPVWKEAVDTAARGGHMLVIRWMTERDDGCGPWKADYANMLEFAVIHGHLDVVQWLLERGIDRGTLWNKTPISSVGHTEKTWRIDYSREDVLRLAAELGHFEVLKFIYHEHTDKFRRRGHSPMSSAVANGHLAIAQWLHDVKDERCSAESVDQAAKNGHLEMLQWLDENHLFTCTSDTMEGAAANGRLEVVKWLHETHHECCSSLAIGTAASNCHLELVEWFYENVQRKCQPILILDSTCVTNAAAAGRFDMLRWMHEHYPWVFTRFATDAAAASGRMDVITWLHEHRREGCSELAPYNAARNGHLGVLQWIYKHYPSSFGPELPDIMDGAAGEGHLEVVQWLHETRPALPATNAMYNATMKGHLDVFLYLLEHRPEGFSLSSYEVDEAQDFRVLCHFDPVVQGNRRSNGATDKGLSMLQTVFKQRPEFLHDCLRCLAKIAGNVGNIAILDWVNQFGVELRSTAPVREAVSRGDVKLLQCFFLRISLRLQTQSCSSWRFKAASWRIAGEEMYSRYTDTPVLRWVVENGPPLDLPTATALVLEYRHIEVAWWASEDIRKHLVLQALETDDRRAVWWILAHTQFEDGDSQQSIRETIQCCQGYTKQWFEENMRDVQGCSWYFSSSIKRQAEESEGAALSRLKRRRCEASVSVVVVITS